MKLKFSAAILGLAFAISANATQLFTNTGFETGSLSGVDDHEHRRRGFLR
jgi:hypothetical protein